MLTILFLFKRLRKSITLFLTCIIFITSLFIQTAVASSKILITINQFVNHPALDDAKFGIEAALKDRLLLPERVEIKFGSAQGNIANAVQIAQYHASLDPAFMVAIATPSAQASLRARNNSTLAFLAVTDPIAAGFEHINNIIGVSDAPDISRLLDIAKELLKFQTIGVIFNPGESNSVQTVEMLKKLAATSGIKVQQVAINSSADVKVATQKLIGQVELIYLPKDNLVVSALDNLIQVTSKAKVPVIANDPSLMTKGLLLAYGCDYFESGKQLGNMIADLVEGKELATKIQSAKINKLQINHKVAAALNIHIPKELELQETP
ncbi:ABC transporter substrate binding protein [Candidatus Trichorickettsia mobilis]|uniref:ABC transporter substrate binding protein n=1 Tax=Candidatus Trichorickettsia mobilis TaxID=1346319 RepID=A0ABZ0USP5_9RICK|nr:ABC transporter substrate-binding protein [Candidatus Trichorickettsia mobilis]WPY00831.1 ABC transporter substrate binding protein [Candidatus Trichorickettsia mobilis]